MVSIALAGCAGATPKQGRNPYRGNPPNPIYQKGGRDFMTDRRTSEI
jgi:hypothetical protein